MPLGWGREYRVIDDVFDVSMYVGLVALSGDLLLPAVALYAVRCLEPRGYTPYHVALATAVQPFYAVPTLFILTWGGARGRAAAALLGAFAVVMAAVWHVSARF